MPWELLPRLHSNPGGLPAVETPVQRHLESWPLLALHRERFSFRPSHTSQPLPPMAARVLALLHVEDDWGFRGEDLVSYSSSNVARSAYILLTIN